MRWNFFATFYWVAWLFAFIFWEAYAGSRGMGDKDVPMLTQAVVRYVPWWVTMPFLTWLFVHFVVRYANPSYGHWLRTGTP